MLPATPSPPILPFTYFFVPYFNYLKRVFRLCVDQKNDCMLSVLRYYLWSVFVDRMGSSNAIDTISATWEDYARDFVHIKPAMFDVLIQEGQRRILREYLRALLSRFVGCYCCHG